MKKFFVGCNIHFEDELEKELSEFWPYLLDLDGRPQATALRILDKEPGGLLVEAPLHIGLQINFFSKLANRVLLRVKEFKVRDFPKLFQTFSELKKDVLLKELGSFQFEVAARESRLNNEKRILQILCEVFGPADEKSSQSLYVRISQDQCTVSLDTTGSHLHKRTERLEHGEAPLRETLAAFCARKLIGDFSASELSGITLIDPMCGTGSLLREAATLYQPTLREDFPFLLWSQTPKLLKSPQLKSNYPQAKPLFAALEALDRDAKAVERAGGSLAAIPAPVRVRQQDLFQSVSEAPAGLSWVISNPPYGERLKADFEVCQLIRQIDKIYHPQRMALLLGEKQVRELEMGDIPMKIENKWKFKNGGLPVQLILFVRLTGP